MGSRTRQTEFARRRRKKESIVATTLVDLAVLTSRGTENIASLLDLRGNDPTLESPRTTRTWLRFVRKWNSLLMKVPLVFGIVGIGR